ncbi:hypothetical protein [Streptomyces shenzhenensis]
MTDRFAMAHLGEFSRRGGSAWGDGVPRLGAGRLRQQGHDFI